MSGRAQEAAPPAPRLGEIAGIEFQRRQIVDRVGIVRVEPDGGGEIAPRRIRLAVAGEHAGEVEPRLDEARVDLDGSQILRPGLRDAPGGIEAGGAVEGGGGIERVEDEAAPIEHRRFLEAAHVLRRLGRRKQILELVAARILDRQQHLASSMKPIRPAITSRLMYFRLEPISVILPSRLVKRASRSFHFSSVLAPLMSCCWRQLSRLTSRCSR